MTAATFQSTPGPEVYANYSITSAQIQGSPGRPLSGGRAVTSVPLIAPGRMYGDRVKQLDLRGSRIFKVGRTRIQANVDLYNLLNSSAVLFENSTYGPAWRNPIQIMPGRFVKFGTEVTF